MHCRKLGPNGTFVVFDALLLAPNLAFSSFAKLRDAKSEIRSLDGEVRLDHATLRASREG